MQCRASYRALAGCDIAFANLHGDSAHRVSIIENRYYGPEV